MEILVSSESSSEHTPQEGHHQSGPLAVLFVFFGLLCGCILREINKKTGVPYTPMLLVLGIIFGYCRQDLGSVGQSITIISTMSPHMILLVFIPILIFESAFNCDWHVFRKSMLNILLLAGPGVLWGAIIIAVMLKVILGYGNDDLTWYEALALGCVLSATDPVAVVALLKELGASVQFNILVQGESLLNDGTAMVFFMLFMSLVKGESASALGVISNFVRVSIGGPLLGIIIGFMVCWWLKKIIRDTVLTVMITFIGAFLCFYIAEFTWVKVSGILSIVSLGLFFSAVGKLKVYPQSQHALHSVWASIQYGSQTLIFILTGIVVGIKMIDETTITTSDWVKMFIFWLLMILSRAIMVLTFYPFLRRSGYGVGSKQLIVLIYGGLRGALGLCLSLFVGVDDSLRLRFRELTVFYMCGMAMLTIVVNGLTCSKLVNYLQMIKVPQIKQKLLKRCVRKVLQSTQLKLKQLKSSTSVSYAKWKVVQRDANVKQFGGTFHQRQSFHQIQLRDSIKQLSRSDVAEQIRFRFCRFLQTVIWQFYEQGELSEESVKLLDSTCNIANDEIRFKIRYFDILSGFFDLESIEYYLKFKNTPILGNYCTRSAIHKIYLFYQTSTVFVQACQEVLHKFQHSMPVANQHLRYVLDQVKQSIQSAQAYIGQLQNGYPKIIQAVHTERATTIILKSKRNELKYYYREGFIDEGEYSKLRKQIDFTLVQIRSSNQKLEQMKLGEIFSQYPLFSELTSQQLSQLRMKAKDKTYQKGNILIRRDSPIKYVTIIISGSVKEQFKDEYDRFYLIRSIGCVLDAYDFTYMQNAKCEAKARNTVRVLQIEQVYIRDLLNNNSQFKKRWYKFLFVYCQHIHPGLQTLHKNLTEKEVRRLVQKSQVCLLSPDNRIIKESRNKESISTLQVPHGAFIFDGQIEYQRNTYVKGSYIPPGTIKCLTSKTVVLKFEQAVRKLERGSVINERLNDED